MTVQEVNIHIGFDGEFTPEENGIVSYSWVARNGVIIVAFDKNGKSFGMSQNGINE